MQEAQLLFATIREIAASLLASGGDHMLLDTLLHAEDVISGAENARRTSLLNGLSAFGNGRTELRRFDIARARPRLEEAQLLLAQTDSPLQPWVEVHVAICIYYTQDYPQAARRLRQLETAVDVSLYPLVAARVAWVRGLIETIQGNRAAAVRLYDRSLSLFQQIGERENSAVLKFLLAESWEQLGMIETAWSHRHAALREVDDVVETARKHNIYFDAADAASRLGQSGVALAFQNEMVLMAQRASDALGASEALLWRSRTQKRRGDVKAAEADIRAALATAKSVPDPSTKRRALADAHAAFGEVFGSSQPRRALAAVTQADEFYRRTGDRSYVVERSLALAHLQLARGKHARARQSLLLGLAESRGLLRAIEDPLERRSFATRIRPLFTALVNIEAADGDTQAALHYSDMAHDQPWLEPGNVFHSDSATPSTDASPPLNNTTALVEYLLDDDGLRVWVQTSQRLTEVRLPVHVGDIAPLVAELHARVRSGDEAAVNAHLGHLHGIFFGPVRELAAGRDRLVIVPDGGLAAIPWPALLEPRTGRFLVEEHEIIVAPSFARYRQASATAEKRASRQSLLAVGDPTPSAAFPELAYLPGAHAEIAAVAMLYPQATILTGDAATGRRFLATWLQPDVVHIAAHARGNGPQPGLSHFVLSQDLVAGDDGLLFARDIQAQKGDPTTGLVVLSGCSTSSGSFDGSSGALDFAGAFMRRGVPTVVASLWEVEDGATKALISAFHRAYSAGSSAAAALRQAQRKMLQSGDRDLRSPSEWGSFVVLGGANGPAYAQPNSTSGEEDGRAVLPSRRSP